MERTAESDERILSGDDEFRFSCRRELDCFNKCCNDVNIYLTPMDIVEMRDALGVKSGEFLSRYAFPLFPKAVGHPVVVLKMEPGTRQCPFTTREGCSIYEARPWSCRSFPLEPVEEGRKGFRIIRRDFCLGFEDADSRLISEWRESQDMELREAVNGLWATITHHPAVGRMNLLEGAGRDMFFLASYNPDEFRRMVFETDFLKYFAVEESTLKEVKEDDVELLAFAFQWLRTVLFGEKDLARK